MMDSQKVAGIILTSSLVILSPAGGGINSTKDLGFGSGYIPEMISPLV
jgi:hypothetical protein